MSLSAKEVSGISRLTIAGAIAAVFQLLSVILVTRGAGVTGFGVYALAIAYVSILDRLLNFQSWQALISFGARYWERSGSSRELAGLTIISVLIDLISAITATVFAFLLIDLTASVFSLPDEFANAASIASYGILLNQTGASTALLRLSESYDKLAFGRVFSAIAGTFFAAGVFLFDGGVTDYVLVYVLTIFINSLLLIIFSKSLYLRFFSFGFPLLSVSRFYLQSVEIREMMRFLVLSNVEGSIKILREVDVIFVGKVLGVDAAGLYRISKRIAEITHLFIDPFYQVVLPAMSKCISNEDHKKIVSLMVDASAKCTLIILLIMFGFFVFGKYAVTLSFGEAFSEAYKLTLIMMFGAVIWALGSPLVALNLSIKCPKNNLISHLIAAIVFLICIAIFSKSYGVYGAAVSVPIFSIVWILSISFLSLKSYRQV